MILASGARGPGFNSQRSPVWFGTGRSPWAGALGTGTPPPPRKDNGPRGVAASTLDSESSDRGSNPRGAFPIASNVEDHISDPSFSGGNLQMATPPNARCATSGPLRSLGQMRNPNVTSAAWDTFDDVPMRQNAIAAKPTMWCVALQHSVCISNQGHTTTTPAEF